MVADAFGNITLFFKCFFLQMNSTSESMSELSTAKLISSCAFFLIVDSLPSDITEKAGDGVLEISDERRLDMEAREADGVG